MLGAQRVDARLQIADLVAALLDLHRALRLGEPLRDRADGLFRIGAGKVMHRRIGIDLRLGQSFTPCRTPSRRSSSASAALRCRTSASHSHNADGSMSERHEHDQEPGQLVRQRLGAERVEQCGHFRRLGHDNKADRQHENDDADADKLSH